MTLDILIAILMTVIGASTPILIAALGELVVEKSGVLNLGIEGMMLIGAIAAFAVTLTTGNHWLGLVAAMIAATAASMIFAVLTLTLMSNQVATGLALTIFGIGMSSLVGEAYVGKTVPVFGSIFPESLATDPVLRLVFGHSPLVYLSLILTVGIAWFLTNSRSGLILRAVGESDTAAHSIGYPVIRIRYMAVAFGGAMAGLAGAYFSLVLVPLWTEGLTAGRGWIALALVVFSSWKPWRLFLGAYLFGLVMTMELHSKAAGLHFVAPEFLAALPYLATVVVLAVISWRGREKVNAPACLGKPFRETA